MLDNDIVIEFDEEPHEFYIERDKDEVSDDFSGWFDWWVYLFFNA